MLTVLESEKTEIFYFFPQKVTLALRSADKAQMHTAQEIRLRIGGAVCVCFANGVKFLSYDGTLTNKPQNSIIILKSDMEDCVAKLCNYSLYSSQNQIKNGFITVKGGHRAGICGTCVMENNEIVTIRDISSINFRIARDIVGCAVTLYKLLFSIGIEEITAFILLIKEIAKIQTNANNPKSPISVNISSKIL